MFELAKRNLLEALLLVNDDERLTTIRRIRLEQDLTQIVDRTFGDVENEVKEFIKSELKSEVKNQIEEYSY